MKPGDLRGRELPCGPVRANACRKERLVGVDVAESSDPSLIEQDRLHGRPSTAEQLLEIRGGEPGLKRLRPQARCENRLVVHEDPATELPQVAPAELVVIVEPDAGSLVRLRRRGLRAPDDPARHPQVRRPRPSIVEPEEQVLPSASQVTNDSPAKRVLEPSGGSAEEERLGRRLDEDARDASPDHEREEVTADRFHLGKFGHRGKSTASGRLRGAPCRPILGAMITYLRGRLARLDLAGPCVEIEVGGVRYEILVPLFLWPEIERMAGQADLDDDGARPEVGLHISYHVSANAPVPVLVGFLRRAERDFFRKFVTVEGMGPTKAVRALTISVSAIARAIEQEDRALLTKLPGVGPRAADKIIAALRGKVTAEAAMHDGGIAQPVDPAALERARIVADAVAAITGLGYSRADAKRWVEEALALDPGLDSVEALTLAVLRARGAAGA